LSISKSIFSAAAFSLASFRKAGRRDLVLAARAALGVEGGADEGQGRNAWDFKRILERQEQTLGGPFVGLQRQQVVAVQAGRALGASPCVTS
jgi:hypothetical protein